MTAGFVTNNVRHWSLPEVRDEKARLTREIEKRGMSVLEMRYRASEWELDADELGLLKKYERLARMLSFADGDEVSLRG